MSNVIVELTREMRRVQELFPKLDRSELERAQRTIHFANVAMTTNNYAEMRESIDDLRAFQLVKGKPA